MIQCMLASEERYLDGKKTLCSIPRISKQVEPVGTLDILRTGTIS